jgi:hypothetical protein
LVGFLVSGVIGIASRFRLCFCESKTLRHSLPLSNQKRRYWYAIGHNVTLPSAITITLTEIWRTGGACGKRKILTLMPEEPQKANAEGAGYITNKSANGRARVEAQFKEQGATIGATR